MKRRIVIALSILGLAVVVLALALASVGSELDQARIDRDDYLFQVEDLQGELDAISEERERLQTQVDEQLKAIEQWKVHAERSRGSDETSDSAEPAPAEPEAAEIEPAPVEAVEPPAP
jgi:hypothetical protein